MDRRSLAAPVLAWALGAAGLVLGVASWWAPAAAAESVARSAASPEVDAFEVKHRQAVAANPPDVVLTLGVKGRTNRFRQGEAVRLDLGFSSTSGKRYELYALGYDRSGRLDIDELHLSSVAGVEDPIWEYFANQRFRMGGGMGGIPILGESPDHLTIELNEWVRFDRPGTFRLYVSSHRVKDLQATTSDGFPGVPVTVSSNVVELTIDEADAEWSGHALGDAIRAIDESGAGESRRAACKTLRFLGSPAAAREMARRYDPNDRDCSFELMFGLIGSPARDAVIQAMSERIEVADGEVDGWFLANLALIACDRGAGVSRQVPEVLGRRPRPDRSFEEWRIADAKIRAVLRTYAARLLASLPRKIGRARAVCALTLLELTKPRSCGETDEPPVIAPTLAVSLRQQIAASFSALPAAQQYELLSFRWGEQRGPAMAAALRRIYAEPPALPWQGGESLRSVALRRLYELAPAEATALLLAEARRPVPRVDPEALGLLSEEAASGLEVEIVEHLEAVPPTLDGLSSLSFLVARYATRAVLPRVQAYYENKLNDGMCLQPPLIAYFLRVDPALGKAKLAAVLDAPPRPERPNCAAGALAAVGKLFYSADLESLAISHLDDLDLRVAIEAADLLGHQGSPAAQAPLWRRLERWHAKWQGRDEELKDTANAEERSLAYALREAIAQSPSWVVDLAQLERLRDLGVGPDSGAWLKNLLPLREAAPGRIALGITFDIEGHPEFRIAQYTLHSRAAAEAKLGQFPRGTAFGWLSYGAPDDGKEQAALVQELAKFIEGHGMAISK